MENFLRPLQLVLCWGWARGVCDLSHFFHIICTNFFKKKVTRPTNFPVTTVVAPCRYLKCVLEQQHTTDPYITTLAPTHSRFKSIQKLQFREEEILFPKSTAVVIKLSKVVLVVLVGLPIRGLVFGGKWLKFISQT